VAPGAPVKPVQANHQPPVGEMSAHKTDPAKSGAVQ
jgi:hypothetical protein